MSLVSILLPAAVLVGGLPPTNLGECPDDVMPVQILQQQHNLAPNQELAITTFNIGYS